MIYIISQKNKEYDWSRSNSRSTYEKKTEKKEEKKDDWFSQEAEYTRQFFKIRKNWKLQVKEDVVLVDPQWIEPDMVLPEWVYEVMNREDYWMYEDEKEYEEAFKTYNYPDETDDDNDY